MDEMVNNTEQNQIATTPAGSRNDEKEAEYNQRFRKNPQMWSDHARDAFAAKVVKEHWPEEPLGEEYPILRHIIDVGCGNGHTLEHFQHEFPHAKFYGGDISGEALRIVAQTLPDVCRIHGELSEIKKLDWDFDVILAMGALEHILDLPGALRDIKALLKEDGICYMEIPNNLSYSTAGKGFHELTCGSRQMEWHLTREQWEEHIRSAGLVIVSRLVGERPEWEFVWVLK